ncbi:hypothetical protein RRG08_058769 [Elysia crispata]|uniref:Uncharacterized protein n=1 Tax=Elysia crispata TaxID=231223 RepID=A0AAE0YWJ8_9GAST|nr:hypothetical protein RRG08_058769 [Elysia crispata]
MICLIRPVPQACLLNTETNSSTADDWEVHPGLKYESRLSLKSSPVTFPNPLCPTPSDRASYRSRHSQLHQRDASLCQLVEC